MRRRIVFSVAALIAVLATPSTTTPLEFKDDAEAVRLAAEQGDAGAQFNLGVMYANGEGVLGNDAEAVRWYRTAEQGHAALGSCTRASRRMMRGALVPAGRRAGHRHLQPWGHVRQR